MRRTSRIASVYRGSVYIQHYRKEGSTWILPWDTIDWPESVHLVSCDEAVQIRPQRIAAVHEEKREKKSTKTKRDGKAGHLYRL